MCSVDGCTFPSRKRGWCNTHYSRWYQTGTTDDRVPPTVEDRFWSKVDVRGPDECWLWTASLDPKGYGKMYVDGHLVGAHVVAYRLFVGPVPAGHDVDHQCHNDDLTCAGGPTCLHRRCANFHHLTAATRQENLSRGRGPALTAARYR